jgi:hypothetical protein
MEKERTVSTAVRPTGKVWGIDLGKESDAQIDVLLAELETQAAQLKMEWEGLADENGYLPPGEFQHLQRKRAYVGKKIAIVNKERKRRKALRIERLAAQANAPKTDKDKEKERNHDVHLRRIRGDMITNIAAMHLAGVLSDDGDTPDLQDAAKDAVRLATICVDAAWDAATALGVRER